MVCDRYGMRCMRIFREYKTDKRGFQGGARGICFCELGIAFADE